MVINIGAGTAGFSMNYLAGWMLTYTDPNHVLYLLFACALFMCALIVVMQTIASRQGYRDADIGDVMDEIDVDYKVQCTDRVTHAQQENKTNVVTNDTSNETKGSIPALGIYIMESLDEKRDCESTRL